MGDWGVGVYWGVCFGDLGGVVEVEFDSGESREAEEDEEGAELDGGDDAVDAGGTDVFAYEGEEVVLTPADGAVAPAFLGDGDGVQTGDGVECADHGAGVVFRDDGEWVGVAAMGGEVLNGESVSLAFKAAGDPAEDGGPERDCDGKDEDEGEGLGVEEMGGLGLEIWPGGEDFFDAGGGGGDEGLGNKAGDQEGRGSRGHEPRDVAEADVRDFVSHDGLNEDGMDFVEERVGEEDEAEAGGCAQDGGVDCFPFGVPDEDAFNADAVASAHGEEGFVEWTLGEGMGVPDASDDDRGDEEDEECTEDGERGFVMAVLLEVRVCEVDFNDAVPGEDDDERNGDDGDVVAEIGDEGVEDAWETGTVGVLPGEGRVGRIGVFEGVDGAFGLVELEGFDFLFDPGDGGIAEGEEGDGLGEDGDFREEPTAGELIAEDKEPAEGEIYNVNKNDKEREDGGETEEPAGRGLEGAAADVPACEGGEGEGEEGEGEHAEDGDEAGGAGGDFKESFVGFVECRECDEEDEDEELLHGGEGVQGPESRVLSSRVRS